MLDFQPNGLGEPFRPQSLYRSKYNTLRWDVKFTQWNVFKKQFFPKQGRIKHSTIGLIFHLFGCLTTSLFGKYGFIWEPWVFLFGLREKIQFPNCFQFMLCISSHLQNVFCLGVLSGQTPTLAKCLFSLSMAAGICYTNIKADICWFLPQNLL